MSVVSGGNPICNFGANVRFTPQLRYVPQDEQEVLDILDRHRGRRIRVGGRLHCWSDAVVADDVWLDLRRLNAVRVERQKDAYRAVVGGGCQIKRLLDELRRQANVTMPTVGLITEQTIAGAISTGTHGSGRHSLSHYIDEIRLATYDAETGRAVVRTVDSGDALRAGRCSLGAMGVILSVTIRCRSVYNIEEHARRYAAIEEVLAQEESFPLQQLYLIPWLWRYYAQHRRESDAGPSRLGWVYRLYWLLGIDIGLHVIVCLLARVLCRPAATRFFYRRLLPPLIVRRWHVVDRADRMLVMEHELFRHVEMEVFVHRGVLPCAAAFAQDVLTVCGDSTTDVSAECRRQLSAIGMFDKLHGLSGKYHHHYPICIRKVLADDTLISMASGSEPYYAISFISYQRPKHRDGFFQFASFMAEAMAKLFGGRAHWGKVCPLSAASCHALYPHLARFRFICESYDPQGRFRNDWVSGVLGFDNTEGDRENGHAQPGAKNS